MGRRQVTGAGGLWTLVVPVACPGCGLRDVRVCAACRTRVLQGPLRRRVLGDGTTAVASCAWRGPASGLVGGFKERGRDDVLPVLALALARAAAEVAWPASGSPGWSPGPSPEDGPVGAVLLVPPPWSWRSRLARAGDRPADRLARAAAAVLVRSGGDVRCVPALRATRLVRDQAGLDRAARAENLAGAHRVRAPWQRHVVGAPVVVVDDVLTSGSTVLEASRALRAAGALVLGAASVAHA